MPISHLGLVGWYVTHVVIMVSHIGNDLRKVTVFTNGPVPNDPQLQEALTVARALYASVETRKIVQSIPALREEPGGEIVFADGTSKRVGFLVDKPPAGVVGQDMIAEGLRADVMYDATGTNLKRRDPFCESNVTKGFVAGDTGSPLEQVTIAATAGLVPTAGISKQLCSEEGERVLANIKDSISTRLI